MERKEAAEFQPAQPATGMTVEEELLRIVHSYKPNLMRVAKEISACTDPQKMATALLSRIKHSFKDP